jgi:hypothetical protein
VVVQQLLGLLLLHHLFQLSTYLLVLLIILDVFVLETLSEGEIMNSTGPTGSANGTSIKWFIRKL